jgi:hypothetical protein
LEYFTRRPELSLVDTAIQLGVSGKVPDPSTHGVREVSALGVRDGSATPLLDAIEHVWFRDPLETERDFLAQALAAARELGFRAVRFSGVADVTKGG